MLQELKNLIYSKYSSQDKIGFFFSLFDAKGKLLVSNGILTTDKALEDLINLLYNGIIKKYEQQTKHIIIDFIQNQVPQNDIASFLNLDPKQYGVILSETEGSKTGIMLPNTSGVNSMKDVLSGIKSKYQLQGNVSITTFTVDELYLDLK